MTGTTSEDKGDRNEWHHTTESYDFLPFTTSQRGRNLITSKITAFFRDMMHHCNFSQIRNACNSSPECDN